MTRASAKRSWFQDRVFVTVYRHTHACGRFNFNSFSWNPPDDLTAEQKAWLDCLIGSYTLNPGTPNPLIISTAAVKKLRKVDKTRPLAQR